VTGRPRIALVHTGGTLTGLGKDRLDLAWYAEAGNRLGPGEFLTRIPEVQQVAEVYEQTFRQMLSHAMVDRDWLDLLREIHRLVDEDGVDGVVIGHGTNTLEETAHFLTLTLKRDRPVVLVGAMRPASGMSTDGELNVVNAVRVAASRDAVGRGVLVVLNDTIHSGRDVTKTATYRVQAFDGRDLGPLGYADADGRVVFYHASDRRHTMSSAFDVTGLTDLPRVDIVISYVGAAGALIDAAVAAGARGIVSAGTGAGQPTPAEAEALDRARAQGIAVCQATRVGSGRVVRSPGLTRRGFVAADNLPPWKARTILSLALTVTDDPHEIQALIDTH
jgi:L-asparaginase